MRKEGMLFAPKEKQKAEERVRVYFEDLAERLHELSMRPTESNLDQHKKDRDLDNLIFEEIFMGSLDGRNDTVINVLSRVHGRLNKFEKSENNK